MDRLEKCKKNDSMEENINSMINDLLKEEEMDKLSIKGSEIPEIRVNERNNSNPMISINIAPVRENFSKKLILPEKKISMNVGSKSNILTTNFSMNGGKINTKKKHVLQVSNISDVNNFTNSPKNFQTNYSYMNAKPTNHNINSNFHSNPFIYDKMTKNFHNHDPDIK